MQESESLLRQSQRVARLGHYVFDIPGDRWTGSEMLDELFGLGPDDPRTFQTWIDVVHPESRQAMVDYFQREVVGRRQEFNREYRIINRMTGEALWVHGLGSLDVGADGAPVRMFGTIQDITARKAAEEEREKLQAQLVQAQKMESVGRLAGGVAHDFNNMLGVILGYTDLLLDEIPDDDPKHQTVAGIRSATQRSAELTRQLLAFARKQTVSPKVLDLNATVAGSLKMLRRLIGEDIDLAWSPAPDAWPVKIDPSQVDQILANLCVNARDAIRGVGKVTIETANRTVDREGAAAAQEGGADPGDYVTLSVTDTGCGMARDVLQHLFEPFFTTKGVGQGTGLGLAVLFGIVKQNGGFINVYSEPDRGTTFRIYLPRHHGEGAHAAEPGAAPLPRGKPSTVLLVEDEPMLLEMGRRMLESLGYRVLTAGTPSEALRIADLRAREIELLVTDVVMPEMNGIELAARLVALYPGLKRLFMSGYTANVFAHDGLLDEGVHFLQKPFSRHELAAAVTSALEEGRPHHETRSV